jgi:hypothetical protein
MTSYTIGYFTITRLNQEQIDLLNWARQVMDPDNREAIRCPLGSEIRGARRKAKLAWAKNIVRTSLADSYPQ